MSRQRLVGEDVEVLSVSVKNHRRELIATCKRGNRRYDIALLDIDVRGRPSHLTPHCRLSALARLLNSDPYYSMPPDWWHPLSGTL